MLLQGKFKLSYIPYFLLILFLSVGCLPQPEGQKEQSSNPSQILQDGESQTQAIAHEINESFTTNEDASFEISKADISQDWDSRSISTPSHGSVIEQENGVTYEPFVDYVGSDEFKVEYKKGNSVVFTQNITVLINPINDAPVAVDDTATVASQKIIQIDVLSNDSDVDENDELTLFAISEVSNGSASIEDGKISYQSEANFSGVETLTYQIKDKDGLLSEATVSINVVYSSTIKEGSGLPIVPVRIAFVEKSDGTKITDHYASYAQNIVDELNKTYTDGQDQKLKFVLDVYDGIVNDDYFVTPSNQVSTALGYFASNHRISGKVNLFFVERIQGGVAGVAYLNQIVSTTGMFERMPTAALEKNVVGHEVGHNIGFRHTADNQINSDRMRLYTRCNPDIEYFQKAESSYTINNNMTDGWGYGGNLMYPIASPNPSSLFTGKYDVAFSDIMECWHDRSNWPMD